MNDDAEARIECASCGEGLPDEWISSGDRECPVCGSDQKKIYLNFVDETPLDLKEVLQGKLKDGNYSAKKNPRYEFFEGADISRSDGRWMEKVRIIDKYENRYFESVVDPDTGEIIHQCEELLSDHRGHGSDRPKKGSKPS